MATSLEISKKEVQIDYLHPKKLFPSVKRLRKSVQRSWDNLSSRNHYKNKKNKKKEINARKIYSQIGNLAERAKQSYVYGNTEATLS